MAYTDSRCDYVEVRELWRVYVPSERSWNKAVRELEPKIKPVSEHYYQTSFPRKSGHQIDLMHWQLTVGEDQLQSHYPDW